MSKALKTGVTAVAYTGGTSENYQLVPDAAVGSLYVNEDEVSGLRSNFRLKGRPPVYSADGTVKSKMKTSGVFSRPIKDATTGEIRYASVRVEVIVDPRDHATQMSDLRYMGCQLLSEVDFANLYLTGSEA